MSAFKMCLFGICVCICDMILLCRQLIYRKKNYSDYTSTAVGFLLLP